VADEVFACGRRAILVKADVAQTEQVRAMVSAAQEGLGPIDALINNAGVFPRVYFLEMTERDWDHVLEVNLKGSCFCAQYVAKAMASAERWGSIINIVSGAARRGSARGDFNQPPDPPLALKIDRFAQNTTFELAFPDGIRGFNRPDERQVRPRRLRLRRGLRRGAGQPANPTLPQGSRLMVTVRLSGSPARV
jgi:NAD(P)-dependent dehydrogenase (short-subunit alcohol dehydrogenase family)